MVVALGGAEAGRADDDDADEDAGVNRGNALCCMALSRYVYILSINGWIAELVTTEGRKNTHNHDGSWSRQK